MNKMYKLIVVFTLPLALFQTSNGQCNDNFLQRREIEIKDSHNPLGNIESVNVLDSGDFVVATDDPPQVVLFSPSGDRIRQISDSGPGPYEYKSPSIVRSNGDTIYVWDKESLKLIAYKSSGEGVDEWTSFSRSVSDFVISRDTLHVYHTGGLFENYVAGYIVEENKREILYESGNGNIEHTILTMLSGSGTISKKRDSIFFASPSRQYVYKIGKSGGSIDSFSVADNNFSVEDSNFSSVSDISSNQRKAIHFATSNSRFYKLNSLEHGTLAALQHGKVKQSDNLLIQSYDRYINVHYIYHKKDRRLCERIDLDKRKTGDDPIVGYTKDGFIFFKTLGDDEVIYKLVILHI